MVRVHQRPPQIHLPSQHRPWRRRPPVLAKSVASGHHFLPPPLYLRGSGPPTSEQPRLPGSNRAAGRHRNWWARLDAGPHIRTMSVVRGMPTRRESPCSDSRYCRGFLRPSHRPWGGSGMTNGSPGSWPRSDGAHRAIAAAAFPSASSRLPRSSTSFRGGLWGHVASERPGWVDAFDGANEIGTNGGHDAVIWATASGVEEAPGPLQGTVPRRHDGPDASLDPVCEEAFDEGVTLRGSRKRHGHRSHAAPGSP